MGVEPRHRLWSAAPAMAALLVYASTLSAGFVYDDHAVLETNRLVQDPRALARLFSEPLLDTAGIGSTNYYRPVVTVLYNLTWRSLGGKPVAFHALNVLVHALGATLVTMLARRLTRVPSVAVGAGVLFAVHPLGSEAVAWASGLPELAYVALGLGSLVLHVESRGHAGRRGRALRAGAWVLFGLACASKETAVVFLPLLALLEVGERPRDAARALVPYVAVAALYLVARTVVLGGLMPPGAQGLRTAVSSIWNAPWLLLKYVGMLLVPWPLSVQHAVELIRSPADPRFFLGAALVAALATGAARLRRARPDLAFAACLAVVPLLPALYLPALGRDPFAERYAYLGTAGFCWLLVGGVESLASGRRRGVPAWAVPALVYLLAIPAAAATVRRCGDWRDDQTLGAATIRVAPAAPLGYLLRAEGLVREGRREEALAVYRAGLERAPASVELQQRSIGLAIDLGRMGRDEVLAEYERLVPLSRDSAPALFNLGHALMEGGRLDAAEKAFVRALELAPQSAATRAALGRLGSAYRAAGREDDARRVSEIASRRDEGGAGR